MIIWIVLIVRFIVSAASASASASAPRSRNDGDFTTVDEFLFVRQLEAVKPQAADPVDPESGHLPPAIPSTAARSDAVAATLASSDLVNSIL